MSRIVDAEKKRALCARLARIEGQVRGLQKLIDSASISAAKAFEAGALETENLKTIKVDVKMVDGMKKATYLYSSMDPQLYESLGTKSHIGNWSKPTSMVATARLAVMTEQQKAEIRGLMVTNPESFNKKQAEADLTFPIYSGYGHLFLYDKNLDPIFYAEVPDQLPVGLTELPFISMTSGYLGDLTREAAISIEKVRSDALARVTKFSSECLTTGKGVSKNPDGLEIEYDAYFIDKDLLPESIRGFTRYLTGGQSPTSSEDETLARIALYSWRLDEETKRGQQSASIYEEKAGIRVPYSGKVSMELYNDAGDMIGFCLFAN